MNYGALTGKDVAVLESVMRVYAGKPCRFLEIGVHHGGTSRGVLQFMQQQNTHLEYWGIDNGSHPEGFQGAPFSGANFLNGDSAEVYHLIPDHLDIVLVDGCHCINHVVLDTLHYGFKTNPNGFLVFHDTAKHVQRTMKDPHGPNIPDFHNSVLAAHALMGFPSPGWVLWKEMFEPGHPWGGMTAYRKDCA